MLLCVGRELVKEEEEKRGKDENPKGRGTSSPRFMAQVTHARFSITRASRSGSESGRSHRGFRNRISQNIQAR